MVKSCTTCVKSRSPLA